MTTRPIVHAFGSVFHNGPCGLGTVTGTVVKYIGTVGTVERVMITDALFHGPYGPYVFYNGPCHGPCGTGAKGPCGEKKSCVRFVRWCRSDVRQAPKSTMRAVLYKRMAQAHES